MTTKNSGGRGRPPKHEGGIPPQAQAARVRIARQKQAAAERRAAKRYAALLAEARQQRRVVDAADHEREFTHGLPPDDL